MSPAPAIELGTRFRTIQSQVSTILFDSGNSRSVELPRSFLYKAIRCRLRGSNVGVSGTATPQGESPLGLIKRLDIVADGRKVFYSVAGADAWHLSNLFQGKCGEILQPTAGATISNLSASFMVHFEAARMLTPIMSYFDPRPYEKVEARVQWGTTSDIWGVPSTASIGAETCLDIQPVQSAEGAEQIGFNRLTFFDEYTFAAAVTNFPINIPRSGLLAGIQVRVYTGNVPTNAFFQSATAQQTNVFGNLTLKSDNNFLHCDNLNPTSLQIANMQEYLLDYGPNVGTTQLSSVQPPVGYYYIDLTEDGLATSLLNTFDLNVLQLLVSSAAGASFTTPYIMRLTYVFYEPITAA